jgi:E3 ubiquitin-protein ligase UBR4
MHLSIIYEFIEAVVLSSPRAAVGPPSSITSPFIVPFLFLPTAPHVQVHELKRSRSIAALSVHYTTAPISEIAELKHNPRLWKRAFEATLAPGQATLKAALPVPIVGTTALKVVLESFHINLQEASCETIQCPRCSHIVRDRHGVCTYCHENAYQCRQCRNINYECLDGFLCNECGHSRFGRIDFSVTAAPSSDYPVLEDEDDVARALAALAAEADTLHNAQCDLSALRAPLVQTLASCGLVAAQGGGGAAAEGGGANNLPNAAPVSPAKGVSRGVAMLGVLYSSKCQAAYQVNILLRSHRSQLCILSR